MDLRAALAEVQRLLEHQAPKEPSINGSGSGSDARERESPVAERTAHSGAAKRRAEDLANRARYLDQLGRRQPEIWKPVAGYVQTRQPKDYDRAVSLLIDLHDLAVCRGQTAGFQAALEKVRQVHAAKEGFLRRLAKANL